MAAAARGDNLVAPVIVMSFAVDCLFIAATATCRKGAATRYCTKLSSHLQN